MSSILVKQNDERNLQRLSAQRELYTSAKRIQVIQILVTIFLPVGLSFLGIRNPEIRIFGASFAVFIVLINMMILERIIKSRREKASKIQELFDCDVLELPSSPLKTVDNITVDDVIKHYHAHNKVKSNVEKIRDWYSKEILDLPLEIARLICQRTNCYWDKNLRQKFIGTVLALFLITISSLVFVGVEWELTLEEMLLCMAALLPFLVFCLRTYNENIDSICRLRTLISYVDKEWKNALTSQSAHNLTEISRRVQDEIFTNRSRNALMPDLLYNLTRNKDEEHMNRTATELRRQYLDSRK